MLRRIGLGMAVAAAFALLPAAAGAHVTRRVYAGPPPNLGRVAAQLGVTRRFQATYQPDINAFFNHHTTIHVGDTVSFRIDGFHTIDIPRKGGGDLPFVLPGAIANGYKDAAGVPFWFNGHVPLLGINPALFARSKNLTYTGRHRLDSGIASSKPFNVRFTHPGTYKFFCDIHPGMVGYITVRPRGRKIPSARQVHRALLRQERSDVRAALKLARFKQPTDVVNLGRSTAAGVELFAMFPNTLTVHRGTVVTFRMSARSRETHTATFGPPSYLGPLASSFQSGTISPIASYPSDPYQPLVLTPHTHGNGFVNTGLLDRDPTTRIGPSSKIDFTTPGTYHYVCLVHPWMHGTIVVK